MTTVLTICSVNYLAQARTLGDSLREQCPDCHFVIGLVDRYPDGLSREYCGPYEVLPVEDLGIRDFEDMRCRYNIVELNTAVKPFYMEFLYGRDPATEAVIYLDPDIQVLGSLHELEAKLRRFQIIFTPHSSGYELDDVQAGYELSMLGTGIYNLGFLATARGSETAAFLSWWQRRLVKYCYYQPGRGLFVDQLWANLVPLYFESVYVEKDPGYNMSYWNLGMRTLSARKGRYVVNAQHDLVFYHFSSYTPLQPRLVSHRTPPVELRDHPELQSLFDGYRARLLKNGFTALSELPCAFYIPRPPPPPPPRTRAMICREYGKRAARAGLQALPKVVQRGLRRVGWFLSENVAVNPPGDAR
jgi:hypothetical protein